MPPIRKSDEDREDLVEEDEDINEENQDDEVSASDEDDEIEVEEEDEPGDEDAPGHEEQELPRRQARTPDRGNRQFGKLRQENRTLRRELDEVRGGLNALNRVSPAEQRREFREAQREESERLANMDETQRAEYFRQKDRNDTAAAFAQQSFRTDDRLDRAEFRALCDRNPAYADVAETVEAELRKLHAQGQRVDREVLANIEIGKRAANKTQAGRSREERRRIENKNRRLGGGRPNRGGSDTQDDRGERRGKKGKTAAERLEGVKF